MTVAFYTALLALFYVFLSIQVIRLRGKFKVALGDSGHPALSKAIRAHANFAEYVPLSLLLIYFVESLTPNPYLLHGLCLALLTGRIVHALNVSRKNEFIPLRVLGMIMTFTSMVLSSLYIMLNFFCLI